MDFCQVLNRFTNKRCGRLHTSNPAIGRLFSARGLQCLERIEGTGCDQNALWIEQDDFSMLRGIQFGEKLVERAECQITGADQTHAIVVSVDLEVGDAQLGNP